MADLSGVWVCGGCAEGACFLLAYLPCVLSVFCENNLKMQFAPAKYSVWTCCFMSHNILLKSTNVLCVSFLLVLCFSASPDANNVKTLGMHCITSNKTK